ncbi:MAG TPA: PLP-dependent aminotransferase family protein [Deltaproteobacteria bacterium]|nr:PLP-dependent aminotransferase family protein [Deltaproteobacteria bacterium]HPR55042.1 PLP-dependent aminotransferase family protein [Deltaproteobacteria bacterium]HXK47878.1 PLP-dependent aminotransferase family protein [Deltaproteobacteria bacterium]
MEMEKRQHLYEEVADHISSLVVRGTFRAGERIPSIRSASSQWRVSITTAMEAYRLLEDRGVIEARPQSGYYVRPLMPNAIATPCISKEDMSPVPCNVEKIVDTVFTDSLKPDFIQLGATIPNSDLLPVDKLSRCLCSAVRRKGNESVAYSFPGDQGLRTQIAKRAITAGCSLAPEDILITSGCQEAAFLALKTICKPGDTVVIESPAYFCHLQAIQGMGLKVIEVPCCPEDGISLDALNYILEETDIKACLLIPNYSNPIGSCMPDRNKEAVAKLLARHDIPLIEDDINGDLSFSNQRPRVIKAFDEKGLIILCSSFSKTIAPGYRVGWMTPGRFKDAIEHQKLTSSLSTATPPQMAVAEFLVNGGYDHHLRRIRRIYARQVMLLGDAIARSFPEGTKVTRPTGGFFLWVEMPEQVDSFLLYEHARRHGITIAPGPIFTVREKYRNYIRLSAAFWSDKTEKAVKMLGTLAGQMV